MTFAMIDSTVLFLHCPIGVYYMHYVVTNGLAQGMDWLLAIIYLLSAMVVVGNGLTYKVLAGRDSNYPFDAKEMARFHVMGKMGKLRNK